MGGNDPSTPKGGVTKRMPKIDSMIDTMANTASIATKFASACSAADTIASTLSAFASPINIYDVEVKHRPAVQ